MRNTQNNQGFSLVELMVVVAIIGILASVAIPQYSKFQAKARQTEAKSLLATMYTAEKGFFVEANAYTSCLASIGVAPEVKIVGGAASTVNVGFYALGFQAAQSVLAKVPAYFSATPAPAGTECTDGVGETFWTGGKLAHDPTATAGFADRTWMPTTTKVDAPSAAAGAAFIVSAAGAISSDKGKNTATTGDQWTVDDKNTVINVRSGI